jgi:hypothetical protein
MTKVEAVARAIHEAFGVTCFRWQDFTAEAEAAIEAGDRYDRDPEATLRAARMKAREAQNG